MISRAFIPTIDIEKKEKPSLHRLDKIGMVPAYCKYPVRISYIGSGHTDGDGKCVDIQEFTKCSWRLPELSKNHLCQR